MTNGWTDIRNADVVLAMGGNPAENHPVGFRFVMEARRNRNAKLICIDPRFNRTAAVADAFVQIRVGTDIAFLGGLIHYALSRNRFHTEYVRAYTNATYLLKDSYAFDPQKGLFSGWNEATKSYTDTSSWSYQLDERGFARTDPTMEHPQSVFQVMKTFSPVGSTTRRSSSNARTRSSFKSPAPVTKPSWSPPPRCWASLIPPATRSSSSWPMRSDCSRSRPPTLSGSICLRQ